MKKNIFKIAIIATCIIGIIGLFLPYRKSIGEYRKYLIETGELMNTKEVNFKNKDIVDISILESFKVYNYAMNNSDDEYMKNEGLINVIITIVLIMSLILIFIFTITNKNILIIIFDVMLAFSSLAMNYDITSRGIIPSIKYTYGISYYLYILLSIIILAFTIITIVTKNKK